MKHLKKVPDLTVGWISLILKFMKMLLKMLLRLKSILVQKRLAVNCRGILFRVDYRGSILAVRRKNHRRVFYLHHVKMPVMKLVIFAKILVKKRY